MDLHNPHNLESTNCYDAETGQNTNEVATPTNARDTLQVDQPTTKKQKCQGWYGRMTEEQRAEYLLKQHEARQQKRFAGESIENAQTSLTLEPQGTTNVFTADTWSTRY
jgi:hypothetical protein